MSNCKHRFELTYEVKLIGYSKKGSAKEASKEAIEDIMSEGDVNLYDILTLTGSKPDLEGYCSYCVDKED